jgi:hypothetical protein
MPYIKKIVILTFTAIFVPWINGCAERAANINPAFISDVKYSDWSCEKLISEKAFVDDALPRVGAQQDAAADNDALMVFLIGVPTSGGGIKSEVARLKGEQEALRKVTRDKNCASRKKGKLLPASGTPKSEDVQIKIRAIEKLWEKKLISEDEYKSMIRNVIGK